MSSSMATIINRSNTGRGGRTKSLGTTMIRQPPRTTTTTTMMRTTSTTTKFRRIVSFLVYLLVAMITIISLFKTLTLSKTQISFQKQQPQQPVSNPSSSSSSSWKETNTIGDKSQGSSTLLMRDNEQVQLQQQKQEEKEKVHSKNHYDNLVKESKQQHKNSLSSLPSSISSNNSLPPSSSTSSSSSFLSICLLIKDDNDILSEWILYHYHSIKLRHLIVAIDPSSQTVSPTQILQQIQNYLPQFTYTIWQDENYMPNWFLNNNKKKDNDKSSTTTTTATSSNNHRIPNLVPKFWFVNASTSPFHQHLVVQNTTTTTTPIITKEQLEHDYNIINTYWFRQRTFVTQCMKTIRQLHHNNKEKEKKEKQEKNVTTTATSSSATDTAWMAHIDTDEYIVVNPILRGRNGSLAQELGMVSTSTSSTSSTSYRLTESYVLNLLEQMIDMDRKRNKNRLSRACIIVPTILFGSVEMKKNKVTKDQLDHNNNNNNIMFLNENEEEEKDSSNIIRVNPLQWETIRWNYHADYQDHERNGYPKVLMDLVHIPSTDHVWTDPYVFNPHQPSKTSCKRMTIYNDVHAVKRHPLVLYHYIGSWERYSSRNDTRRSRMVYDQKSNLTSIQDDRWIGTWVDEFVKIHGIDTIKAILGNKYFVS